MSTCNNCGSIPGTNPNCPVCGRWASVAEAAHAHDDLVRRCAAEHGINEATVLEIIQWLDEEYGQTRSGQEEVRQLNARFRTALQLLVSLQGKQRGEAELRMSTRALCLVLGYATAAGASDCADLGKKLGLGKATVNKCYNQFAEKLDPALQTSRANFRELAAARPKAARENMSRERLRQLRPTKNETK